MITRKKLFTALLFSVIAIGASTVPASAKPSEYDRIVKHLKTKYQAKKVSLGFVWLARAAVKLVRPAGVKSFNITLFKDLKISRETVDTEMQAALRESFGPEWSPVFRVRSRDAQQAYMYMREDGKNVKLTVVTIDAAQAAVVRATFSPEKLAEFINDPRIFGISLTENDRGDHKQGDDGDPDN